MKWALKRLESRGSMKIFVPNQTASGETRVAMVPAVAKKLASAQVQVLVESGAGVKSSHSDDAFRNAGAQIVGPEAWAEADIVTVVQPPELDQVRKMKKGAVLAGMLAPHKHLDLARALADQGVSALALELLPR